TSNPITGITTAGSSVQTVTQSGGQFTFSGTPGGAAPSSVTFSAANSTDPSMKVDIYVDLFINGAPGYASYFDGMTGAPATLA
ncbi:hypothetical protein, partial [Enterococcus faecalis]|uniref:hypothetical protein n=1 Tax=Enterococcus faecalis TaxID=1351 RepID=UPI00403F78EF